MGHMKLGSSSVRAAGAYQRPAHVQALAARPAMQPVLQTAFRRAHSCAAGHRACQRPTGRSSCVRSTTKCEAACDSGADGTAAPTSAAPQQRQRLPLVSNVRRRTVLHDMAKMAACSCCMLAFTPRGAAADAGHFDYGPQVWLSAEHIINVDCQAGVLP
jgi:hypothetical protein